MPIAKLKYLVTNGDLATRNFVPWVNMPFIFINCYLIANLMMTPQLGRN
jgi:hypothetical protein